MHPELTIELAENDSNKHYFLMNFIFKPYPEHPWFSEWTLEPRDCHASFRKNNSDLFFQTLETVGKIIPNMETPDWALQIPVPQNSRINMMFNGFCSYFEKKKKRFAAEVLIPEAGVLWGRTVGIPAPVLTTALQTESNENFQWLESDNGSVLLAIRNGQFCLVTKSRLQRDALQTAEIYFERDFEESISEELQKRNGVKALFEEMIHHDSMAVICVESMMKALRPAEGNIPMVWCQSSSTHVPQLDINELQPLALAWRYVDIKIAEELVTCALKIQTNAGAIPVHFSPHTTHSVLEAPKPFLAKTIETVWNVRKSDELLTVLLPPLYRHLQWLLHHFDPKRNNYYCWKNRNEPIVPEIYETDLSTVDLTVLLLTEIEALNRLRSQSSSRASDSDFFKTERDALEHNLLGQFWNSESSDFSNAYIRDKLVSYKGFAAFTPLMWDKLPNTQRATILEHVRESGSLPGGLSVLSWRKNALDDDSFPLLQQLMVFQALNIADPHGQLLGDFSRITLQGFVEWHTLSLEEEKTLHINPVLGAYIMNVQAIRQYRYHAQGAVTGFFFKVLRRTKADRFDLAVLAATLFMIFCVHLIYSELKAPPPLEMLKAQMNNAYTSHDGKEALKYCMAVIQHYPDQANRARLMAANLLIMQNRFKDAEILYRQVREKLPDAPGAMIALGLTCQLQGNFKEAEENYFEFCYIFDEIFPELVAEVNDWRKLALEEFRKPPKWREMYRYRLMHEL